MFALPFRCDESEAIVKVYQGERTEFGCQVTVDGMALPLRSDLSADRTTTLEWGGTAGWQLSLALLADLLGNDRQALQFCETFNQTFVTHLPRDRWTLTDDDLARALASVDRRYVYSPARAASRPENPHRPVAGAGNRNTPDSSNDIASGKGPESTPAPAAPAAEVTRAMISKLAYQIWESNGRRDGHALEDWVAAEARLRPNR